MSSQGCALLTLAEIRRSKVMHASRGKMYLLPRPCGYGGRGPRDQDSQQDHHYGGTLCARHGAQRLGGVLAEELLRPIGTLGAWDREKARLLRCSQRWGSWLPF